MIKKPFNVKKYLFGKISRKLTLLFFIVGIVAPTMGILYFYIISTSFLYEESSIFSYQLLLLQSAAILIITLIAINAAIIGLLVSRKISKPILRLYTATQEIQKGNYSVRTNINTNDEIQQLGQAINKTTEALEKLDEQRKGIDKSKSEFISITSHELRTPITPMKAQLQMLDQGYFGDLTPKQKESVTIILQNTERLNRIIEDFLEISRIESARLKFVFKETNLYEMVKDTIKLLESFAKEKQIKLELKAQNLPIISVDPDRFTQVLRNLIHNAIKFSKNNGEIVVSSIVKNDYILFCVKDDGPGMSYEDSLRIFEPFYQIESHLGRKHGGTGLGLAICRGIIESQKGKIWVESQLNKGSAFYFTVPTKPVKEIEPIKVLFSSKSEIENKIKEEFTEILGPMGSVEFNDLKNKNMLGYTDIIEYIYLLKDLKVISSDTANIFQTNIEIIFGKKNDKEQYLEEYGEDKL
ncbi:MAG: HAMP domain-containing sensor histidine kinase [Thermoplasmatota archaeon]